MILYKNESKPYKPFGGNINVKVDLSNYATRTDFKNATGIDTSKLATKSDLLILKAEIDKLDIDKLSNLKNKVDKLDMGNSETTPVDLSKLSNVVKNNAQIKNIEDKIPDITNLAIKTTLNAKMNEVKAEIPIITYLATTTALTSVENKTPNVSNLVKKNYYNTKVNETKKKITDHSHDKHITT